MGIEKIKSERIPALFADNTRISEYGGSSQGAEVLGQVSTVMEGGALFALTSRVREIVRALADADPRTAARKSSWMDAMLGRDVERQVLYRKARKDLDQLLEQASGVEQRARDTLRSLDAMLEQNADEIDWLKDHIVAGRQFLDENPLAGAAKTSGVEFDNPRERFARKLTNLTMLLSSHEMTQAQMKLARAQAVDMLDRFTETATVLVPVWRHHTLAMMTAANMSPAVVAQATEAHVALMHSLASSLENLDNR